MNDKLSFSIRKKGNITVLDLYGKIIGSWAFAVKDELSRLKDSGVSSVILNFQGVTSIDSLGVMAIISALESGLIIKVIHLNTTCRQIFEQNKAVNIIPVYGTEEEAMGYISRSISTNKEMRRYKRINTNIPVEILVNNSSQRGVLLNISEGGALVGYLDPLNVEPYTLKYISIIMTLQFLGYVEIGGRPVRYGRSSEMNIIGMELPSTEKSRKLVKQVSNKNTTPSDQSDLLFE